MTTFTVVFDACVLYPFILRDVLIELAVTDIFRAKWTADIHEEWIKNLNKNKDIPLSELEILRQLMDENVRDCLVEGYTFLIPAIKETEIPDKKDAHVIAAAIHCHADMIVTKNLKDFPQEVLDQFNIEAQHPDDFLLNQLDMYEPAVIGAIKTCRARLRSPKMTVTNYLKALERNELPQTSLKLRTFAQLI